jgi:hypothetical protein
MTPLALAKYVRFKTRTNSTTFSDTDMLPLVLFRQDELARRLMMSLAENEDIFQSPNTDTLVANHREYAFPPDILSRITRVEAKLDGTNFVKLHSMDKNQYEGTHDETTIVKVFNSQQWNKVSNPNGAQYDIARKAIYIYSGSIIGVVDGLKLWCYDYPAPISSLTDNTNDMEEDPDTTHHGFPRELHELLARGVIIDYKESREKPIPLSQREQNYDKDVLLAIASLKGGDTSREIISSLPPASERGNNGFDY